MKKREKITLALSLDEFKLIYNGLFALQCEAERTISSAEEYSSKDFEPFANQAKADLPIIRALEDKMWQIKYDAGLSP